MSRTRRSTKGKWRRSVRRTHRSRKVMRRRGGRHSMRGVSHRRANTYNLTRHTLMNLKPRTVEMDFRSACIWAPSGATGNIAGLPNRFHVFCNSIYSPTFNTLGNTFYNTPTGYNFLSRFYNHYDVLSCKCTWKFTQMTAYAAGVLPSAIKILVKGDDNNALGNVNWQWNQEICDPNVTAKTMYFTSTGGSSISITKHFSRSKVFPTKTIQASSSGAAFGYSPTEMWSFIPFWQTVDEAAAVTSLPQIMVEMFIVFKVFVSEPTDMSNLVNADALDQEAV